MSSVRRTQLEETIALCLEARRKLGPDASFRTRTLIDMLLFDLGKELAGSQGDAPPGEAGSPDHLRDRS